MNDKLKNFLVRTASGAVLLLVVLGAAFAGPIGYGALLLLITGVGVWEFYSLARAKGSEPQRILGLVGALALTLGGVSALSEEYMCVSEDASGGGLLIAIICWLITALSIMIVFVAEVFRNRPTPMHNIATTIMGIIYVALPMAVMSQIPAQLQQLDLKNPVWEPLYFLFYLFLVWGNDVFAYLFGITLGKHKLCERLSPKKSWEGFVGGIIGSVAVGAIAAAVLDESYIFWIGLAIVVALSSVVGDLIESMFKRDAGVKDSGNILPGHGGMLDRFDALIVSAPFAFVYITFASIILNIVY
ncbi:MAG: phosphatidate cytidylyltransferase [Alistipes sp.]|nr:phosphatidate cytidylyltransferase [Alistipes sp.]